MPHIIYTLFAALYSRSASLPSTIDATLAVQAFTSQRCLLLNLIRHCLPSLANSLLAKCMIPRDIYKKACNETRGSSERGVTLLDCIEARIELVPSDFTKVLRILQEEPFLEELADGLIHSYCEFIKLKFCI